MGKRRSSSVLRLTEILLVLICCSGFSFLMPFRMGMIVLFALGLISIYIKRGKLHFTKSNIGTFLLLFVFLMSIGIFSSYDQIQTVKYVVVFCACIILVLVPNAENFHYDVCDGIESCVKVIAFSIIINLLIPNLYSNYLYFLISRGRASVGRLNMEINNHVYSGLMGEKGEAAYIMVIAIMIQLSKCIASKKIEKKDTFWLCVYFVALLLPAKRVLFVIAVLLCMMYWVFWTRGRKKVVLIGGFGGAACLGILIVSNIPAFSTLVDRFIADPGSDTANGRYYLWERAIEMYQEKPIFGYGFGSFNKYASYKGVILTASHEWESHAHDIYIQVLGEMGIVGLISFILLAGCGIATFINIYKKKDILERKDLSMLFLGGSIQILTLIYGISGNCIYYTNQILVYCWGLAIIVYLNKKYSNRCLKINGEERTRQS
jgi:O-antigen ligase